jgi:hypothetical protein
LTTRIGTIYIQAMLSFVTRKQQQQRRSSAAVACARFEATA